MSNDFRSLLSTFQAATTGQSVESSSCDSLLDATTQLWRLVQLQKSIKGKDHDKDSTSTPNKSHLAVCLCIVDDLPHRDIWKEWIESDAQLYIHAKHPDKIVDPWTKSKLLNISHKPDWNDVRIVKAMLSLAQEALRNEHVTHIFLGTESCLPLTPTSADAVLELKPNTSYLQYYDKQHASRFEERECWNAVEPFVPSAAIFKALPGWCVLSRKHVQEIVDLPKKLDGHELIRAFTNCWAPEEVYFPTALALLGYIQTDAVVRKSLVHAEWNERARNERDRAHPRCFDGEFDRDLVRELRSKGCLFVRKVKYSMPLHEWQRAVQGRAEHAGQKRSHTSDRDYERDRSSHKRRHDHHEEERHRRRRLDDREARRYREEGPHNRNRR